jgi:hypothetical protein
MRARGPLRWRLPARGSAEPGSRLGSPPWKRGRLGAAGFASRASGLAP